MLGAILYADLNRLSKEVLFPWEFIDDLAERFPLNSHIESSTEFTPIIFFKVFLPDYVYGISLKLRVIKYIFGKARFDEF